MYRDIIAKYKVACVVSLALEQEKKHSLCVCVCVCVRACVHVCVWQTCLVACVHNKQTSRPVEEKASVVYLI